MRSVARALSSAKRNRSGEARETESGSGGKFWFPPGHFYSPIPSLDEIRRKEEKIFDRSSEVIPGIDMNADGQLALLKQLRVYYREMPFGIHKSAGLRFFFDNPSYSLFDAVFLYCMIRHLRPKKIIEVGSGYSSCLMLDTNELFFGNSISLTFIEPHPELMFSLIKDTDRTGIEMIPRNLQDVDPDRFSELAEDDILFIDSTHVSKVNSDVNYILFEILPRLKNGVYIHFHDIFYPFEYPKEWFYEGLAWNEAYILKAFLQYNCAFSIQLSNTYLEQFHRDELFAEMPLPMKYVGASIWIKKM
jgi:predicted O-methyltransferase YrrM